MKNVLFVDCCIRREASNTKKLAEAFLSALPSDCAVTRLDLMAGIFLISRTAILTSARRCWRKTGATIRASGTRTSSRRPI